MPVNVVDIIVPIAVKLLDKLVFDEGNRRNQPTSCCCGRRADHTMRADVDLCSTCGGNTSFNQQNLSVTMDKTRSKSSGDYSMFDESRRSRSRSRCLSDSMQSKANDTVISVRRGARDNFLSSTLLDDKSMMSKKSRGNETTMSCSKRSECHSKSSINQTNNTTVKSCRNSCRRN